MPDREPTRAEASTSPRLSVRALLAAGILLSLLLAGVASFYASSHPDGLEYVAEQTGFSDTAREPVSADSPLADYATSGVEDPRLSGALAALVGSVLVLALGGGLFLVLRRRDGER